MRTIGRKTILFGAACAAVGIGLGGYLAGESGINVPLVAEAEAAGGVIKSPTGTAPDRYAYYPGTEALSKDEIRVIACGTGMPAARHGQAATCWLVELGNGDKFLFDVGASGGCAARHGGCVQEGERDKMNRIRIAEGSVIGRWE